MGADRANGMVLFCGSPVLLKTTDRSKPVYRHRHTPGNYATAKSQRKGRFCDPPALKGGCNAVKKGLFGLSTSAYMIPHPAKAYKGGEDAMMVSPNGNVIAVADGVGSWADQGVNPSLYSATLMKNIRSLSKTHNNPLQLMNNAYQQTHVQGSSTCCVLSIEGCTVRAANLGDSGFVIIRRGRIVHRSKTQQHAFNFPYQLGTDSDDLPQHADVSSFKVTEGDLIVLASDGLWDNIWSNEL